MAKAEQKKKDAQELAVAVNRVMVALDTVTEIVGKVLNREAYSLNEAREAYTEARAALAELNRIIKKVG